MPRHNAFLSVALRFPRWTLARFIGHTGREIVGKWGWVLTGLAFLWLGQLFVWQRGFYSDDYTLKEQTFFLPSGEVRPLWDPHRIPTFPLRLLNFFVSSVATQVMPDGEWVVRAVFALGVSLNALLLGGLVYRVVRSRLAAVMAGWLALMPFPAAEAVLWVCAGYQVWGMGLTLAFLHAGWSALVTPRKAGGWVAAGTLAFATVLLFGEAFLASLALVPVLGLAAAFRPPGVPKRALVRRTAALLACPLIVGGVYYLTFYRQNNLLIAGRGTFDFSPAGVIERTPEYFQRLYWMTVSPGWGGPFHADVFRLGWQTLRGSGPGLALFAAACLSLGLTVFFWKRNQESQPAPAKVGWLLGGGGLLLGTLAAFMPAALLKGQMLEYRLLYLPWVAGSLLLGVLAGLASRRFGRVGLERALLGLAGTGLALNTVGMVGYCRVFAARSDLDDRQIAAFVEALPAEHFPAGAVIVPFGNDEHFLPGFHRSAAFMAGVFEAPWSVRSVLRMAYRRTDFDVITANRWTGGIRFESVPDPETGHPALAVQGKPVPLDRAVLFTYRDGRGWLIGRLTLTRPDGASQAFPFPVAGRLRERGLPVTDLALPTR